MSAKHWVRAAAVALPAVAAIAGTGIGLADSTSLSVSYSGGSAWDNGYTGNYVLKNTGSQTVSGWTLEFDLPSGEKVTSLWNGTFTASGSHVTVKPETWNGNISTGLTAQVGFQVAGGTAKPTGCKINGQACSGGSSTPTTTTAPTTSKPAPTTTTAPPSTTTSKPAPTTTTTAAPPVISGFGAFAPYVDTSLYPLYDLAAAAGTIGTKYFNLAFITDGGNCTPKWGGNTDVADANTVNNISKLRKAGGDVRVSFGGQSGNELALVCSSATALASAYAKVIDTLNVTRIDFDVEGGAISNTAANDRRNQALAQLQQQYAAKGKPLSISYTLPVLPTGLTQDGINVLTSAKAKGATVSAVNIMAMDYGPSFPTDMGQNAINAATATQAQVKSALSLSDTDAWRRIAVTPMIGLNDVTTETFTLANAATLVNFAQQKHLAWLSFWSGARDKQCNGGAKTYADPTCSSITQSPNAFAKAFSPYTG